MPQNTDPQNAGTDTFNIGPGVRAAIAKHSDSPQSNEIFTNDEYSITAGMKYAYMAHKTYAPDAPSQQTGWEIYLLPKA